MVVSSTSCFAWRAGLEVACWETLLELVVEIVVFLDYKRIS
jgi:hypothetical protein